MCFARVALERLVATTCSCETLSPALHGFWASCFRERDSETFPPCLSAVDGTGESLTVRRFPLSRCFLDCVDDSYERDVATVLSSCADEPSSDAEWPLVCLLGLGDGLYVEPKRCLRGGVLSCRFDLAGDGLIMGSWTGAVVWCGDV